MGGKENIKVVCRVRPLNDKEKKKGEHANVKVLNEQQVTPCPNLMSNFLFASFPFAPLPPVRYAPPVTEHVTLRNCLTEWHLTTVITARQFLIWIYSAPPPPPA